MHSYLLTDEVITTGSIAYGRFLRASLSTNALLSVKIVQNHSLNGEVPEWFKGTVLKTVVPAMVPRVRISPSPPR